MRMVSSEEIWANPKYPYGEPIYQVFTYHCAHCKQTRTQTIKN